MTEPHTHSIEARITELTALLERQHAALDELDAISRRQRALIEAADGAGLLELLRGRAVLVERAEAGSVTLARLRQELDAAPPGREALSKLASRFLAVEAIAGRIAERDRHDEALLKAQRDRVAGELAELAMGRRAMGAYGPSTAAQSPRYQDRNG
ncbi:MAG: hypothetical protein WC718_00525 [Phycisphaerales bacterium]|jgi:hypothetical protein